MHTQIPTRGPGCREAWREDIASHFECDTAFSVQALKKPISPGGPFVSQGLLCKISAEQRMNRNARDNQTLTISGAISRVVGFTPTASRVTVRTVMSSSCPNCTATPEAAAAPGRVEK